MNTNVVLYRDTIPIHLGGGVSRRVLAHNENIMIVEVRFAADAIGAVHTHPHLQSTYVLSGRFRFDMDGQTVEVRAGDTLAFPENMPHGTVCLEAGALLDIFSPMREDFI